MTLNLLAVQDHFHNKAQAARLRNNAALWVEERTGGFVWSKQREILEALRHKNVAVKSTFSTGKTRVASYAMAWWIDTQGEDALVVSTAPTFRQVNSLLWEELRRTHANHNLPGEILTHPRWNRKTASGAKVIAGLGIKPPDTGKANSTDMTALQGLHRSDGILAVVDEAAGVSEAIFAGLERITTSPKDRILALCNPTDSNSYFAKMWKSNPDDWVFITISAFDTPNFTGEYVPEWLSHSLPQVDWVERRRKEWGEDSHRWKSEILAEWTDTAVDGLFNMSHVDEAIRQVSFEPSDTYAPRFGVDIAHRGNDSSVVSMYIPAADTTQGIVKVVDEWKDSSLEDSALRIIELAKEYGVNEVRVDAIGIGAGVWEFLLKYAPATMEFIAMRGNGESPDFYQWYNARAYWYDTLRDRLAKSTLDLPDYGRLKDEFPVINYEIRNGSSMLIESKEDMRKRGVKSPDVLDSVVYAVAELYNEEVASSGNMEDDYDYDYDDDFVPALAPF